MPERCEAIAFDAAGTLLYPDPPMGEVYAQVGAEFGSRLTAEEAIRSPAELIGPLT